MAWNCMSGGFSLVQKNAWISIGSSGCFSGIYFRFFRGNIEGTNRARQTLPRPRQYCEGYCQLFEQFFISF